MLLDPFKVRCGDQHSSQRLSNTLFFQDQSKLRSSIWMDRLFLIKPFVLIHYNIVLLKTDFINSCNCTWFEQQRWQWYFRWLFIALSIRCSSLNPVIVGLGPNSGSNIYTTVGTVAGAAVVDRIFLQNMTTPNFVSVILGRADGKIHFMNH
jgi:hypothetical protein